MGQKVNPIGLRLGITRTWDSRWFEGKQYRDRLHEDLRIREIVDSLSRSAAVSRVEIERRANQVRVAVNTAKPGIIIGKRGAGIEELRKQLERESGKQVNVNVVEIKHPELDAKLVANNIVDQLEKRIAFRRAMRQAIQRTMKAGAKGIKVQVGGRLGGAEIARVERNFEGKVPLHTLRANIDYAQSEAYTTFGRIGVKVWIYLGEIMPDAKQRGETAGLAASARALRVPRRTAKAKAPEAPAAEAAPQTGAQAPAAPAPELASDATPSDAATPAGQTGAALVEAQPPEPQTPQQSAESPSPEGND
jgi:small subunit ribosomal protein S3